MTTVEKLVANERPSVDLFVENLRLHNEVLWLTAQVRHLRLGCLVLTIALIVAVLR